MRILYYWIACVLGGGEHAVALFLAPILLIGIPLSFGVYWVFQTILPGVLAGIAVISLVLFVLSRGDRAKTTASDKFSAL